MKHVEAQSGEGEVNEVYSFLEFFIDVPKPQDLHINFGKALCSALKFACDTQYNVPEGKKYALYFTLFLSSCSK
jgi:hypothetical protein